MPARSRSYMRPITKAEHKRASEPPQHDHETQLRSCRNGLADKDQEITHFLQLADDGPPRGLLALALTLGLEPAQQQHSMQ
jgi:hypothetical protein